MLKSSELLDLEAKVWMETGSLKIARQDFKMLALKGGIHAFGGFDGNALNSIEKFSLSTGEWEIAGNLTEARGTYAVALVPADQFCGDDESTTTSNSSVLESPLLLLYFISLLLGYVYQ